MASQPVIVLVEEHLPSSGEFEPMISWEPGNVINTADYYDQIEDSLVLTVIVKARNIAGMEAQDARTITLKKRGCEGATPCEGGSTVMPPSFSYKELKIQEMSSDPCPPRQPNASTFVGGGFRPLHLNENPFNFSEITACFDVIANNWKPKLDNVEIRYFLDICVNNFAPDYKLYDNFTQIPVDSACLILDDLRTHNQYPVHVAKTRYVYTPLLSMHEQVHADHYKNDINKYKNEFDKEILKFQPLCEEVNNVETLKQEMQKRLRAAAMRLWAKTLTDYNQRNADPNYESVTTHQDPKVQQFLLAEIARFKSLYPQCK